MPPPLLNAPGGSTGPSAPPTANMGSEADGDSKVREAVHLLEMALPRFHPGNDKYKACIESLQRLSKQFPASAEVQGVQDTQLLQLQQRAKQSAMMQAAMRQQAAQQGAMGGGGGPPGAGGAPTPQPTG